MKLQLKAISWAQDKWRLTTENGKDLDITNSAQRVLEAIVQKHFPNLPVFTEVNLIITTHRQHRWHGVIEFDAKDKDDFFYVYRHKLPKPLLGQMANICKAGLQKYLRYPPKRFYIRIKL